MGVDQEDFQDLQEDLRDLVHLGEVELINDIADQRRRWWVRPINQRQARRARGFGAVGSRNAAVR